MPEDVLQDKIQNLEQKNTLYQAQLEQAKQAYEQLHFAYQQLLRQRFGQKSERHIDSESRQLSLFEDDAFNQDKQDEPQDVDEQFITIEKHQRCKKTKVSFPAHLPRQEIIIQVSDEHRQCHCGLTKHCIGYETHEILNYVPAVYEIIEEKREKLACPKGCIGAIITAEKPQHILPKTKASESLLAHIVVSKFQDRQPLYHLEKQLKQRAEIELSRQTMARWVIDLSRELQPLYNLCKDEIISYDITALDATSLQVLNEPGRNPCTKSYAYCMRGGSPNKSVVLYDYNAADHKQYVFDWFNGFQGMIHADADPFFDMLAARKDVNMVYCNAHARRKFEPITKAAKSKGLAHHALSVFKQLYAIERKAKKENMSYDERYQLRQEYAKPILEKFKCWLDEHYPMVLSKSPLGKAMAYCINHWDGLIRYLEDGRLEIDNNLTEQKIKPLVIARKNFLFACSIEGAKALCIHFSLIQTALLHHREPYRYYVAVLKAIPHCKSVADYEALLPWNIQLE